MRTIIVKLGGSLVVPEEIDIEFLKQFRQIIYDRASQGDRFVITVGGGRTCRYYQQAASKVAELSDEARDWIGLYSTRLNAQMIRTLLSDIAYKDVIYDPGFVPDNSYQVYMVAGYKPGRTTDDICVHMAQNLKSPEMVMLTNVPYVYDKDPKQYNDAVQMEHLDWETFLKINGTEYRPGMNCIMDPEAAKLASSIDLKLAVIKGLDNFKNYLDGNRFNGSTIHAKERLITN